VRAYKFLTEDGVGVFSRFAWPLPNGDPGPWVESEVEPCRAGIHACRVADLPYWLAPTLYELELDGTVEELAVKVVAPRGRLLRRVQGWDPGTQEEYAETCLARVRELAAGAPELPAGWAPPSLHASPAACAHLGFVAARIAEELGGSEAYLTERRRQSAWLVERLRLD
jgi:hypothetical protein